MKEALLDTDTLSYLMRKNEQVLQKTLLYLDVYQRISISRITAFEVLNGLKAKKAEKQLNRFRLFLEVNEVLEVTEEITEKASDIFAQLRDSGNHAGHNDLLIAATAIAHNRVLVTNNTKDFQHIENLVLENWLI